MVKISGKAITIVLACFVFNITLISQITFEYEPGGNLTQKRIGIDANLEQQYAALELFYNSTNGQSWIDNTNWLEDCDYCTWFGITCDANQNVTNISLFNNNLVGIIPTSIGDLPELEQLILLTNNLSGAIPSELGNLGELYELNLGNNNLSGILPPDLQNASNLRFLTVANNQLTGELPSEYCALNLQIYDVKGNQFTGCYPPCYSHYCTAFGIFDFSLNPNLADFPTFCANNNDNCVCIVPNQDDYDGLVSLFSNLDGNNWTNKNNWLESCDYCTWEGVTCDANKKVIELDLNSNNLSGQIPSNIDQLDQLKELYLNHNSLSGPIPSAIGNLVNLEKLRLSNNELTGPIPTSIGNLTNLTELYLSTNDLTGSIPPTMGDLVNLVQLRMNHNDLTGSIPAELCNLTNLTTLTAFWNDLSGCFDPCLTVLCGVASLGNNPNLPDFNTFCQTGDGECGCATEYSSQNGNALTGLQDIDVYFEAAGLIESDQEIQAPRIVTYDSGTEVWLKPGFLAAVGSDFTAMIDGCDGITSIESNEVAEVLVEKQEINTRAEIVKDKNNKTTTSIFYLGQNQPNPSLNETIIPYRIPFNVGKAELKIFDVYGRVIQVFPLTSIQKELTINTNHLSNGIFYYGLFINKELMATKKMMVLRNK